jgi:surfeit locus 1 family protein
MPDSSSGPPQYSDAARGEGRRRGRLLPALAVLVLTPLFIALGVWQLQRADEKRALIAAFEEGERAPAQPVEEVLDGGFDAARYRHVYAEGRYVGDRQFLLAARVEDGRPGYDVLTPLALANGAGTILVDRGFVPQDVSNRRPAAPVDVDSAERRVEGRVAGLPRAGFRLGAAGEGGADAWPRVMLYPERAELEAALGRPLLEPMLLLDPDEPDGYVRNWRVSDMPPARHIAYALQWFAFAATLVVIYFVLRSRARRAR